MELGLGLIGIGREWAQAIKASPRVATKFGEHWQDGAALIDHSYDSLTAACEIAARTEFIDAIQLPLNARRQEFPAPARAARARGKLVIANRPVDSGAMLAGASDDQRAAILRDSFYFLARQGAADIVLTGTRSASHLRDNHEAFRLAAADADPSL